MQLSDNPSLVYLKAAYYFIRSECGTPKNQTTTAMILDLIHNHPNITIALAADFALGILLLIAGILQWKKNGMQNSIWFALDDFFLLNVPYFCANGTRSAETHDYRGREFVQFFFEMIEYVLFCWLIIACNFCGYICSCFHGSWHVAHRP